MTIDTSHLSNDDLLSLAQSHVLRSCDVDADLVQLLGEIDARQLYAPRAFSSMHAYCTRELGMSDDVACNRIAVARLARRIPRVLDFVRTRRIHLTGLRLLAPVLTEANCEVVLARATGKTRNEIEELVVEFQPKPAVPAVIRKLPTRSDAAPVGPAPESSLPLLPASASRPSPPPRPPRVEPLSADAFKVQFTASTELRDKLEQAKALLRHRFPDGDLAKIVDLALDLLISEVKKERFGVGRKPRGTEPAAVASRSSRHIPDAIKREVYERDGGQCTFTSAEGRRCTEKSWLEFDHIEGFARTGEHSADSLRLLCRRHNQHAANVLYGRGFMDSKRAACPGTGTQWPLLSEAFVTSASSRPPDPHPSWDGDRRRQHQP
jgi:hypothetical protein